MIRLGPRSPQRDLMRGLLAVLGDEPDAVCLAYMPAEREGRVGRPRGAEDLAPVAHARALRRKGWLGR